MELKVFQQNVELLKEQTNNDTDVIYGYIDKVLENDLPLFCQVVLPHMFYKPLGKIHYELFDLLIFLVYILKKVYTVFILIKS